MAGGLQKVVDIESRPATKWVAITPNNSADIPLLNGRKPRSIYATGAGNIVITDTEGTDATIVFAAGEIKPLSPVRIKATGTTATGIIGLW